MREPATEAGVVKFDAVAETIVKLRDTKDVLTDFFAKVADEDAMLLGLVTYQKWPYGINHLAIRRRSCAGCC